MNNKTNLNLKKGNLGSINYRLPAFELIERNKNYCRLVDSPDLRCAGSPSLRLRRKEGWGSFFEFRFLPFLRLVVEMVDERSKVRVSQRQCISANAVFLIATFLFLNFSANAQLSIIPQPVSAVKLTGGYLLKNGSIIAVDKASKPVGDYLQQYLLDTYKLSFKVVTYQHIPLSAAVKLISEEKNRESAYSISVTAKGITITGTGAGLFYGVQSVIQLFPDAKAPYIIPACRIEDEPRFNWRGLSLDVCRHFFTVDEVKKYIDMMAHYKLNVFHWHLTDDEGWRIQIDKYPRLTQYGSNIAYWEKQGKFRKLDNLVGGGRDGFYTKDNIRDVIKYAAARYITILPEIEMPGHSEAAIFAYPELGCKDSTGAKHRVRMLDPSEYTFSFYENVLSEVMELFPNKYIHIGGDEAEMIDWLKSPTAVALMKKEHLKNEREVQSYFIKRIEIFLNSKGKKLIGWDEILQGGLAPSATVMSWQGIDGGIAAAKMHHDVVMTPLPQMYFDAPQADEKTEPIGWNDPVSWQMVYNYEPIPSELTEEESKYVLGAQANIWTEKIPNFPHLTYMVYPRVLAVAELTWTPKADKNISRFERSMYSQYQLFKLWNLDAHLPEVKGIEDIATNHTEIDQTLSYPLKNAGLSYTLDGMLASGADTVYKPFPVNMKIPLSDSLYETIYTKWGDAKQRVIQTAILRHINVEPIVIKADELKRGLNYSVYKTVLNDYNKLDTVKAVESGIFSRSEIIKPFRGIYNTWVKFNGYIRIEKEGEYDITSDFEISPAIYLNKALILYRDQNKYVDPQRAILHLEKGVYQLKGYYLADSQNGGQMPLTIKEANGKELEVSEYLYH